MMNRRWNPGFGAFGNRPHRFGTPYPASSFGPHQRDHVGNLIVFGSDQEPCQRGPPSRGVTFDLRRRKAMLGEIA
jgi:hypothetical protein